MGLFMLLTVMLAGSLSFYFCVYVVVALSEHIGTNKVEPVNVRKLRYILGISNDVYKKYKTFISSEL
jgi:hypothetical protein